MMQSIELTDATRRIVLAHGGGGEMTAMLIRKSIASQLMNEQLAPLEDSAIVPWNATDIVFTTDSYVVTPLEFPGGDIGRLAVAGTVNDIAVMGARPVALSLGFILEEGLSLDVLDRIVASIARTAKEAGIEIVTGDTKVIERRGGDGMFINTAGIGRLIGGVRLSARDVEPGDVVILNGPIAEHGLTIMAKRGGIDLDSDLRSDAAPLNHLIADMLAASDGVRFLRDATRGGVAGVLSDVCETRGLSIEIDEASIPLTPTAMRAADLLGLDPLSVANEGKIVCIVDASEADDVLHAMRRRPEGRHSAVVGRVTDELPALVELHTRSGGSRIVQRPYGEDLPRIC